MYFVAGHVSPQCNASKTWYISTSPNASGVKKKPVVPVSYGEKFFEYFFHGFGVFLLGDLQ
jgi:hypothetical protein